MRWIGFTLLLLAAPGITASALDVPPELAGLLLAHSQQGAEARAEIEQLHGKSIPIKDGYVAHYGTQPPVAMLYVSQARDEKVARQQVAKMTARIRASNGPFHHLREFTRYGMTVYSTLGQGQVHYYFRLGAMVVWVAADPTIAQPALAELESRYEAGRIPEKDYQRLRQEKRKALRKVLAQLQEGGEKLAVGERSG